MRKNKSTRRDFLKGAAGAVLMPYVITSTALGDKTKAPASKRITLGCIGVGNRGNQLLGGLKARHDGQLVAMCDASTSHRDKMQAKYAPGCGKYADFRELLAKDDIDAVIIATPDHWHVPIAMAAAKAGKDMYVEKPLGLTIEQNKALRKAIHRYGSIFQYGTQQRSGLTHCAHACELARNGYLGEIKEIHVTAYQGEAGGSTVPIPVPKGFNYDMWLGPAPVSPYTKDRCTPSGSYHVYDNSIGFIAGWGAHPLDIMHWGYPHIPVEYEGTGVIPTEGLFTAISHWNIKGRFASGAKFVFKNGHDRTTFIGSKGRIAVSRGREFTKAEPNSLLKTVIKPDEIHLMQNRSHDQNFLEAVKTRTQPVSNIDSAVQSDFISHLSDIAIRTGRKIKWDPTKEKIIGDEIADRMTSRTMRSPWQL